MKRKTLTTGLFIILTLFTFFGCTKNRFLKFDTIIEIVVPPECEDCVLLMTEVLDEHTLEDIRNDYTNYSPIEQNGEQLSIVYNPNEEVQRINIHWADYGLDEEDDPDIDPTFQQVLILVNKYWYYTTQPTTEIVGQTEERLYPRKVYKWDPIEETFKKTGEKTSNNNKDESGSSSNALNGNWNQVDGCRNSAGARNYFNFSTSSSGTIGQIDCNDRCSGGGVYTKFNYSISGSSVTITPQSVSDYCGVTPTLASPFTVPFSVSGNKLTLDGQDFEK